MTSSVRLHRLAALAALVLAAPFAAGQNAPAPGPNSDPTYQQLRNITLGTESIAVESVDLKRDAATFHLKSGRVCFVPAVNGKVTGAVFVGDGTMTLDPPTPDERRSLKLLTKSDQFEESFQHLVLRFTDATYDEIKAAAGPAAQTKCDAALFRDSQDTMRHKLHRNLDARILEDVLGGGPGGLFVAFVHGERYDGKLMYIIDPNGAPEVAPEEIELLTYSETNRGIWSAFHLSDDYRSKLGSAGIPGAALHIASQDIDATIESRANLVGKATTTFVPLSPAARVIPFDLFPSLRVHSVTTENGQSLSFVQEDKNDDPDFFVILPKSLAAGEELKIITKYEGKDAVKNEGNGNYYPVARMNWYPSNATDPFSDRADFHLVLRIPKGMKMAASGSLVGERDEGSQNISEWKSDAPQAVAGFQFGLMREHQAKLASPEYLVTTYANEVPPGWLNERPDGQNALFDTLVTMDEPLSEAQFALTLYTDFFGPVPFKRLNMTQQTACNYGQSWPDLVWLPMCSYYTREAGAGIGYRNYWVAVVTPHEVAHQWWAHMVGFDSYRDQWMSEGFAQFSASLFLQSAYSKHGPELYSKFWDDQRKTLIERNRFGVRPVDVGPVTMGFRLSNAKSGFDIYNDLVYPKGAYILQMIRMMMWSPQAGDQNFKEMMHDFVQTYGGKSATTEDFKSTVERHMTSDMNVIGSGKMDWFFNEYVYGTALPSYQINASFEKVAGGDITMSYIATQSGVDDNFVMLIPIYVELADGRIVFVGRIRRKGNSSGQGRVSLKGVAEPPKRALINYDHDVLSAN